MNRTALAVIILGAVVDIVLGSVGIALWFASGPYREPLDACVRACGSAGLSVYERDQACYCADSDR